MVNAAIPVSMDEAFIQMVAAHTKGQRPEVTEFLSHEDMLENWFEALNTLKKRCEMQLVEINTRTLEEKQKSIAINTRASKNAYFAFAAEQERKRANTVRFKSGLEEKMNGIKRRIKEKHIVESDWEHAHYLAQQEINSLRRQLETEHQEEIARLKLKLEKRGE